MKKSITMTAMAALVAAMMLVATARSARAIPPNMRAQMYNWHGNYAYTPYGRPVALVVPPTATLQTNWSWGAASSGITRIDHQFTRDYLGPGGAGMRSTPHWPHNTNQFGVYYVRGPWYPTQSQNRLARRGPCDCMRDGARQLAGAMKGCKKLGRCDKLRNCCDALGDGNEAGCCDELKCCDEVGCCDGLEDDCCGLGDACCGLGDDCYGPGDYSDEPEGCCGD